MKRYFDLKSSDGKYNNYIDNTRREVASPKRLSYYGANYNEDYNFNGRNNLYNKVITPSPLISNANNDLAFPEVKKNQPNPFSLFSGEKGNKINVSENNFRTGLNQGFNSKPSNISPLKVNYNNNLNSHNLYSKPVSNNFGQNLYSSNNYPISSTNNNFQNFQNNVPNNFSGFNNQQNYKIIRAEDFIGNTYLEDKSPIEKKEFDDHPRDQLNIKPMIERQTKKIEEKNNSFSLFDDLVPKKLNFNDKNVQNEIDEKQKLINEINIEEQKKKMEFKNQR